MQYTKIIAINMRQPKHFIFGNITKRLMAFGNNKFILSNEDGEFSHSINGEKWSYNKNNLGVKLDTGGVCNNAKIIFAEGKFVYVGIGK